MPERKEDNVRSFNIAESCSQYPNARLALSSSFDNFVADMFTFTITIRPDHKDLGISRLRFQILGNHLFILQSVNKLMSSEHRRTHLANSCDNWGSEQRLWGR
jgi:hypothetical protein